MKQYTFVVFVCLFILSPIASAQDIFRNEEQRQQVFRLILSHELREIYDQIILPEEKQKWETQYWRAMDPTPNTEKNEFYEEFISRVKFAMRHYSNIIAPLFLDDRGKYYIKYGPPDDRVVSVGIGKPYNDNETWAYYDYNLFIDFVEKTGFGFQEVRSLMEAVPSGPSNVKVFIAAELYTERESLHQRYAQFRDILSRKSGLIAESQFYQITDNIAVEKKLILENVPSSRYSFNYDKEPLTARLSSSVFRADSNLSRVEFYYSFPLKELNFQPGTQFPFETLVQKQLTIFNQRFEKVLQKDEMLKIVASSKNQIAKRIYINQHSEELPAGYYNIALKLDNVDGGRLAILRAQLHVRDFSQDTLMLSDIQISSQIREGVARARHVKPNNILVVPYVGNAINKSRPIYIYFEIYNLTVNDEGMCRYKVSYEVNSIVGGQSSPLASAIQFITHLAGKKRKEKVGSSFDTEGDSEFQQIYLSVDFSKFSAGPSRLTIRVIDLENGSVATVERRFILK